MIFVGKCIRIFIQSNGTNCGEVGKRKTPGTHKG